VEKTENSHFKNLIKEEIDETEDALAIKRNQ